MQRWQDKLEQTHNSSKKPVSQYESQDVEKNLRAVYISQRPKTEKNYY